MDSGFNILERIIHAAGERQKVIASNIANTDTPNYKAKDINFSEYVAQESASLSLTATDGRHLQTTASESRTVVKTDTSRQCGDGNNVELDREIAKMTENALLYEAGVKLLSKKMAMFRNALKGR